MLSAALGFVCSSLSLLSWSTPGCLCHPLSICIFENTPNYSELGQLGHMTCLQLLIKTPLLESDSRHEVAGCRGWVTSSMFTATGYVFDLSKISVTEQGTSIDVFGSHKARYLS